MNVEVVAVGTELLLGQIADSNSVWMGEQLAAAGLDSHFHQAVGDNHTRIVAALRVALSRSDAVVVCGGLGPTQDDITRDAAAEVMGVPLVRNKAVVDRVASMLAHTGREMPASNLHQADVPVGATVIEQTKGTAPGLICPVGGQVLYLLPGVPYEMMEMFIRAVLPDLRRRVTGRGEQTSVITSRELRTWGKSESALAESLQGRLDTLDRAGLDRVGDGPKATIAFLASGIEGIKVRITVKATDADEAGRLLDAEEAEVRAVLGDLIFGRDEERMEDALSKELLTAGLTLGVAESLTGGLMSSRLVDVVGASRWFRGAVVSYATGVKQSVLGVPDGPVVSADAARAMAEGACRVLGADVGLAVTGVAGPDEQERQAVGTVVVGLVVPGADTEAVTLHLPGDRFRVRQYATISAFDLLRRRLIGRVAG